MKKNFKVLSLIAIGSSMVIGAVALSVSGTFSNLNSRFVKASGSEYTVSFSRSDAYSDDESSTYNPKYVYKSQTPNGNDIYLQSTGGRLRVSSAIATFPSSGDSSSYTFPTLRFFKDSECSIPFKHQSISSVKVITSANMEVLVQTSPNGLGFVSKEVINCTSSGVTYSGFDSNDQFLGFYGSTKPVSARSIKTIEITYECENRQDQKFVAGHYQANVVDDNKKNSVCDFYFNDDGYGYYEFTNGSTSAHWFTLFSWSINQDHGGVALTYVNAAGAAGTSIDGMEPSGTTTNYAGFRLYWQNSAGVTTYVGVTGPDTICAVFYTTNNISKNRTAYTVFTKQ